MLAIAICLYWDLPSTQNQTRFTAAGDRIITQEELTAHGPEAQAIWLVVLGEVFDVTKGEQYYGKDQGYSCFSGQDSSAAFVTGEFQGDGLTPSVEGLDPTQVKEIERWRGFYHTDYTYLGKLVGYYYDENGEPKATMKAIAGMLVEAEEIEQKKKNWDKSFPRCNSKWSQADGGNVWCSLKSGGVERTWTGLPRKYTKEGQTNGRCVCVSDENMEKANNHPRFSVYKDCDPKATQCKTS